MIKSLRVGPTEYKVRRKHTGSVWGWMDSEKNEIWIHHKIEPKQRLATELHEAIHAVVAEYGINSLLTDDGEECMVKVLEAALLQLFMQNKAFTKELLKEFSK